MQDIMTWAVIMAVVLLGWVTYAVVFRPQADVTEGRVSASVVDDSVPADSGTAEGALSR